MVYRTAKSIRYLLALLGLVAVLVIVQVSGIAHVFDRLFVVYPSAVVAPVQAAAQSVRHGFRNVFSLRSVYVENAELKARVQELEQRVAGLEAVATENETLRKTLGFTERPQAALVPCTVSGRDPEGLTQTLLLACGAAQGVTVGQGVTAAGYLIGRVVLVTHTTATVRLITASTTTLDVRIASRKVNGVLKGSFGSGLLLDFVPQTADVRAGDLVTTAGINERIPPDVLIGSVAEARKEQGALFYAITVVSPVDLRDIRFVHVLKP